MLCFVQVAKLMQRPRSEAGGSSSSKGEAATLGASSCSSVASSQSLIMEDRPPGLPAKHTDEKVGRVTNLFILTAAEY